MNIFKIKYLVGILAIVSFVSIKAYAEDNDAYKKRIEMKIEQYEKKIEELREQAKDSKDPTLLDQWADGLSELKEKTKEQFGKLKNTSADGWDNLKGGVDTALDKTEKFYENLRRDYYYWKAEAKLRQLREQMKDLEKQSTSLDNNDVGIVKKNFSTFSNLVNESENNLAELKATSVEKWSELEKKVNESLDKVEMSYNQSQRDVKLSQSKQKLKDYSEKISDLKAKASSVSNNARDEFEASLNELERKTTMAKENVPKLVDNSKDNFDGAVDKIDDIFDDLEQTYSKVLYHAGRS